jgi:D-threo-aldose 1-dehydrogenase
MTVQTLRPFGSTGLAVTPIAIGTAGWGAVSAELFGTTVPESASLATARRVVESGIGLLDTSNNYADGESERRIGAFLRESGGLPPGFVLQTKLDRDPSTGRFSAERMWRSLEESFERLGIESVPMLYLHDPENGSFDELTAQGGAVAALVEMRDRGLAEHIGISGGPVSLLERFVETGQFEAVITHNRHTLVDRRADALIRSAAARGMAVVNAAVYGGGLLSQWPRVLDKYHYAPAAPELLAAVDAMGALCAEAGVPLPAAALQFSVRDPLVTTTVVGALRPEHVDDALAYLDVAIGDDLWEALERLVPPPAAWIAD